MPKECEHEEKFEYWVSESVNDWDQVVQGHWEYETKSTCVDIDTHRYTCKRCKKVMYYSGRARDYYEKGITCHVKGLGGD